MPGTTVRECIDDLTRQFPDLRQWINENNPMAWVTVNHRIIGLAEQDQMVSEADEIHIVMLLAGG